MGRGYWYPPNAENLKACDGFFIDSRAVYNGAIEEDWKNFVTVVCNGMRERNPQLAEKLKWKPVVAGRSRFVLLSDGNVDIVAEDTDGYIAVYVLIPEDSIQIISARSKFKKYLADLKALLISKYPRSIKRRINSQHLQDVG